MGKEHIRTPRSECKAALAKGIFDVMIGFPRQVVLNRFVVELGLTEKGASTYYQNCRKAAGLVHSRS